MTAPGEVSALVAALTREVADFPEPAGPVITNTPGFPCCIHRTRLSS